MYVVHLKKPSTETRRFEFSIRKREGKVTRFRIEVPFGQTYTTFPKDDIKRAHTIDNLQACCAESAVTNYGKLSLTVFAASLVRGVVSHGQPTCDVATGAIVEGEYKSESNTNSSAERVVQVLVQLVAERLALPSVEFIVNGTRFHYGISSVDAGEK